MPKNRDATNNDTRDAIVRDILTERERQEGKWGTGFDDYNRPNDWTAFIAVYIGEAARGHDWKFNAGTFRTAMVKVGALAVAAIEWVDRKYGA